MFAVGADEDANGAALWSSPTGEAWKSSSAQLGGQVLLSVAVGDPGIVVVGPTQTGAVAFSSGDGVRWARHLLPGSAPGSSALAVAWGQGRFVAVGSGGDPNAVASWTSTDGFSWVPLSIVEEGVGAELHAVAAGPAGFVVAGSEPDHGGHWTFAVWTSADGVLWQKPDALAEPSVDVSRIRYVGGHFLLSRAGGQVWASNDLRTWTETTVPGFGDIFDFASILGGIVAVGRAGDASESGVVALTDNDLKTWTVLPGAGLPGGFSASAITLSPDGRLLVGVGSGGSPGSVVVFNDAARLSKG
ncbi:MAG TPA: hypothetical protein VKC59_06185 [Candidatus Limnocylindrales bacterium]|nr:hypothetical protein [Candidatus Limnocylindrales bacterium]